MLGLRSLNLRVTVWQAAPVYIYVLLPAVWRLRGWAEIVSYGGVGCVMILLNGILARCWWRGIRRQLRDNDWKFCVRCGYNLADSPDSGNCPECGVEYEIEAVRNKWRSTVRYDDRTRPTSSPTSPDRERGAPRQ